METARIIGAVLVGLLIFGAALFAIVGFKIINPYNAQLLNSYQFDGASALTSFSGFSCTRGGGSGNGPSWCPGSGSFTYTNNPNPITPGQSAVFSLGQAGALFDTSGANGYCSGGFPVCAVGTAVIGGTPGSPVTYQLSGSMSASNWQLIGSTANANWQSQFQETIPTNSTGPCPFTVIKGCNPYTVTLGTGNSTIVYNIYRFAFVIVLQATGNAPVASTSCQVPTFGDSTLCPQIETTALNQALGFINGGDVNKGTILVDLSVPDPFYYSSFGASASDQYGIIGAWIGGSTGCNLSTISFGATLSVTPCLSHTVISNNMAKYTAASNEVPLTTYSSSTLPTSSLNPNAQFVFNLNKYQIQYSAVACSSGSGVGCTKNSSDCLTLGTSGCVINYDNPILQIPMVVDVVGSGPNLQTQARNIAGITSTTTPPYNPLLGNIIVNIKDSILQLPISGIPVNYGNGNSCATSNNYGTTNAQGQVSIIGLSPGAYTVCSTGQTGYVTLIFVTFTFLYSLASQQIPGGLSSGQTVQITLYLQPSFTSALTEISVIIVVLGVVVLGIAWVVSRGGVTEVLVRLKDFTAEKVFRR